MRIWVDADACPGVIKEILYRAADRRGIPLILVANQGLRVPASPWIRTVQVEQGFDVADRHIVSQIEYGELLVTADIPLASRCLAKGARAVAPNGKHWTPDNIGQALAGRQGLKRTGQIRRQEEGHLGGFSVKGLGAASFAIRLKSLLGIEVGHAFRTPLLTI